MTKLFTTVDTEDAEFKACLQTGLCLRVPCVLRGR